MQAFASPVENRVSYPTEGQGGYGKKRHTPLHENVLGLRLTVVSPERPVILSPVGSDVYLSTAAPNNEATRLNVRSSIVKDQNSA
jgi:hypothetical protein